MNSYSQFSDDDDTSEPLSAQQQQPLMNNKKFSKNYPTPKKNATAGNKPKYISVRELSLAKLNISDGHTVKQPHKTDLATLLMKMIRKFENTNITITIDESTFNCHMMVLQCYSELFMKYPNVSNMVLSSKKVTPHAFNMVYEWMLAVEPTVGRDGIVQLLSAAQYLKIDELTNQCWAYLDDEQFSEDSAFLLYLEAREFGEESIQRLMICRIWKFFLTLVATKEFLDFADVELCKLLQSNLIAVNSEMEVLFAAIRWLNHDWVNRKVYVTDIVKCIRFKLLPGYQLIKLQHNPECLEIQQFFESDEVQNTVYEALIYATANVNRFDNVSSDEILQHLNLTDVVQREWIEDPLWIAHLQGDAEGNYKYSSFLAYLDMIQSQANPHWKSVKIRKDSNLMNGQIVPKKNGNHR